MGREVFSRYEKKYLLTEAQYQSISSVIADHIDLDAFNREHGLYTICNIYYDTPDDQLIRKSLSKPVYKEKLRLRSYGVPASCDRGYLEIKKKFKGKVYKRRTPIIIEEADSLAREGILPSNKELCNLQVLDEIAFFVSRYDLKAKAYIAYDRLAFGQDDLRVTFDTNIRTRRKELSLPLGDHGERLLDDDLWLMEVKVSQSMPLWLSELLSAEHVFSQSFSKYGREYINSVSGSKKTVTEDLPLSDPREYIYRTIPLQMQRKGA